MIPCECDNESCVYPRISIWTDLVSNKIPAIWCCGVEWLAPTKCGDCHGEFPEDLVKARTFLQKMMAI